MMKKAITVFAFTGLFSLALFAAEGCCGSCKDNKKDASCKDNKKECTTKDCKHHHAAKKQNNNNNGTEVITTEEEIVIIGEAVPANTAKTPTPAAAKTK